MRIQKVNIPESDNDGLQEIKMDRLGPVVLIAGKNGAGKTRIFDKIQKIIKLKPTKTNFEKAQMQLFRVNQSIMNRRTQLNFLNNAAQKKTLNSLMSNDEKILLSQQNVLDWRLIETDKLVEKYVAINFVPQAVAKLSDPNTLPKLQVEARSLQIDSVGVDHLHAGTLSKIQLIQNRWFEATHQDSPISPQDRDLAISNYLKLQELLRLFFSTTLERDSDGDATLFGFKFGELGLSKGQTVLLQFCIAIFSQEVALKDIVLFLDEPENHLHPSVIIELLDRIRGCVTDGQIWISTHSIPLLAHFDPAAIWYVENGSIKHAGKIPEKVLESLLGDEDQVSKLHDFIGLPAQYATDRYALECLFEPQAVVTGSNDPQVLQIRKELLELSGKDHIKILDYGAGKGRLISNIAELDESTEEKLLEKISYVAFDKFLGDKRYCEEVLIRAYGNADNRYFNDHFQLISTHDNGSFDVVIMCNVLHEIDPKEWIDLFRTGGKITDLLSENGVLLLVEDQQIPTGEKAYQKGFLVLDTAQLKELFKIGAGDPNFVVHDYKRDGRLKAHRIPKNCLERIDMESIIKAIESVRDMARQRIIDVRKEDISYKNGKLHGFWVQQLANAQLNLIEYGK